MTQTSAAVLLKQNDILERGWKRRLKSFFARGALKIEIDFLSTVEAAFELF